MKVYLTGAIAPLGIDAYNEFEIVRAQLEAKGHKVHTALSTVSCADSRANGRIETMKSRMAEILFADAIVALDNYEMDADSKCEIEYCRKAEFNVLPLLKILQDATITSIN